MFHQHFHLLSQFCQFPKQNQAEGGITKIKVNPSCSYPTRWATLYSINREDQWNLIWHRLTLSGDRGQGPQVGKGVNPGVDGRGWQPHPNTRARIGGAFHVAGKNSPPWLIDTNFISQKYLPVISSNKVWTCGMPFRWSTYTKYRAVAPCWPAGRSEESARSAKKWKSLDRTGKFWI